MIYDIRNLVKRIEEINSWEYSVRVLLGVSDKITELELKKKRTPTDRSYLEEAAWTGKKTAGMSDLDFRRLQEREKR